MNQNAIIGLVVAIVVVGGGAWYLSAGSDSTTGEQGAENSTGMGTFAELVAGGGSRTCTVTVDTGEGSSEGTVYIANGQMRGDFTTSVNGQSMTAHMIQKDGYMYNWSDAVAQGVKISLAQAQQQPNTPSQNQGIDPNAQVDYDCSGWMADSSKFDVPSNVTFMELSASGMPANMPAMPANMPNVPSGMMPAGY